LAAGVGVDGGEFETFSNYPGPGIFQAKNRFCSGRPNRIEKDFSRYGPGRGGRAGRPGSEQFNELWMGARGGTRGQANGPWVPLRAEKAIRHFSRGGDARIAQHQRIFFSRGGVVAGGPGRAGDGVADPAATFCSRAGGPALWPRGPEVQPAAVKTAGERPTRDWYLGAHNGWGPGSPPTGWAGRLKKKNKKTAVNLGREAFFFHEFGIPVFFLQVSFHNGRGRFGIRFLRA